MKRRAVLILLGGLLCWGGSAYALTVLPPVKYEGDPDEFQVKKVPDQGCLMFDSARRGGPVARMAGDRALLEARGDRPRASGRITFSFTFAGKTLFWEK